MTVVNTTDPKGRTNEFSFIKEDDAKQWLKNFYYLNIDFKIQSMSLFKWIAHKFQ